MDNLLPKLHPSLPRGMNSEQLATWFEESAVDKFTDQRKVNLTKEETQEYEHLAVVKGREINKLDDILAEVKAHVTKGSDDPLTIKLPKTVGTKQLKEERRTDEDMVEAGAIIEETPIFGIPNTDTNQMEYFTIEGELVNDRTRPLSAKEKHQYGGMFQNIREANKAADGADENGEIQENTKAS